MKFGVPFRLNEHTTDAGEKAGVDFVQYTLNKKYSDEEAEDLVSFGEDLYRHGIELATVAPDWWDLGKKYEGVFNETVPDFRKRLTLATRMISKLIIVDVDNNEDDDFNTQTFREMLGQIHEHTSDQLQVAIRFPWENRNAKIYRVIEETNTRKFMLSIDPLEYIESDVDYKPAEIANLMNNVIHIDVSDDWTDADDEEFQTLTRYFDRQQLFVTGQSESISKAEEEREAIESVLEAQPV